MFQIIPAIDLLNGEVVRLKQGDYLQVDYYEFSPTQIAKRFEKLGAQRIHLVDLDGARSGARVNQSVIQEIRQSVNIPIQLGGGIRTLESAKWYFDLGVSEIVLGSLIISNPSQARSIVNAYPGRCFAGIDVKSDRVVTQGWTEKTGVSLWECITNLQDWPLVGIIFTDTEKDGMMNGPNISLIKEVVKFSNHHQMITAGGVSTEEDIQILSKLSPEKLCGCIIGKAALSEVLNLEKIFKYRY